MHASKKPIKVLALIFMLFWVINAHAATRPTINSVTVEVGNNLTTFTINGVQLCVPQKVDKMTCKTDPVLSLGDQPMEISTITPAQAVATSSTTAIGVYTLKFANSRGKTYLTYNVTINTNDSRGDLSTTVVSCNSTPVSALAYIAGVGSSGYTDANGGIYLANIPTGSRKLVLEVKGNAVVNTSQDVVISAGGLTQVAPVILHDTQTDPQHCATCNNACDSGICNGGFCAPSSCSDATKNGSETDVDCGGVCLKCTAGKICGGNTDCVSGSCSGGVCQP